MKQLLKGGIVVSGNGCHKLDVLIIDDKIQCVAPEIMLAEDCLLVDVSGRLIFPGFIDAHTHFELEVAGTVTADDFSTGTKAAIIGGTTMIIDFATQYKSETLTKALENWHRKSDGKSSCDYGFHLAISDWNDEISKELETIIKEGVSSFKLYMTYDDMILDDRQIYQVLERLGELGGIAGVHCENSGVIKALVEAEKEAGNLSPAAHPITRPDQVEAEAVDRLLKIAKLANAPVIVVHLSSEAGYKEICHARAEGQAVYVETCPQYLLLDESKYQLPDFKGGAYICAPPLRKKVDQATLWEALKTGQIQTVSTDHCSFTLAQKAMGKDDFTKIPGGLPGVETRPVLMYTYGVKKNQITLEQMCKLLSENPAKLYGVYPEKGCIAEGSDADIVVWNPECSWTLTKENAAANVDYQPYEGVSVMGKAELVYLRGKQVVQGGRVINENQGTYIPRKRRSSLDGVQESNRC